MRLVICDDNVALCANLENSILRYAELNNRKIQVDVFYSGEELVNYLNQGNRYDFVLLDIEMKNLSGIDVGHFIRKDLNDYICYIVYISAKDQYDRLLFDVHPFNLLSKPIDINKLYRTLDLAFQSFSEQEQKFLVKNGSHVLCVPLNSIFYFESKNRKVCLKTQSTTYEFYDKLSAIANKLKKSTSFIQIHQSYIVNFNYVTSYSFTHVQIANGEILKVSNSNKLFVKAYTDKYLTEM